MSRFKKTLKNTYIGIIAQFITVVINFANRTIFIKFLGVEYLGIGGLFSNILSMLSLAELGIGVAMVYNLYKPLADNDTKKIKAYMNFYKNSYRVISAVVLTTGLALIPFLDVIIKDKPNIAHFELIYVLFLLNTVSSYWFSYKRSIFSADQNEYVNTVNRTVFSVILSIGHLIVLWLFRSYLIYLIVTIVCTIASNLHISYLCNMKYPYLKRNNEKLGKTEKKDLFKYVFAQMSHKFGGVVVNGTDNILTTSLVSNGLTIVGKYSNYTLFTSTINSVINMFFSSVLASVGNLNVTSDKKALEKTFNKMFFINMCLYGVTASCLFLLANDFISLWVGKELLLSKYIVLIIVINYYISGMRQTSTVFLNALGLFTKNKFKPWLEAAINIIASLIFIKYFGFFGVLLGTLVSTVATSTWIDPLIVYHYGFNKNPAKYFLKYAIYLMTLFFMIMLSTLCTSFILVTNWSMWIIKALISVLCAIAVILILFGRTKEFKELLNMSKELSSNIINKNARFSKS